jgi:hypothetical protein
MWNSSQATKKSKQLEEDLAVSSEGREENEERTHLLARYRYFSPFPVRSVADPGCFVADPIR